MLSSEIAKFLNRELWGVDVEVTSCSSLSNIVNKSVVFAKKMTSEYMEVLSRTESSILAIIPEGTQVDLPCSYIYSANPRLDYIKVVSRFFTPSDVNGGIDVTATVEEGAKIGTDVTIGAHCFIGKDVIIGDGTIILPNVSIYGKTIVGKNCHIKAGAVIGGPGFGFEYDEQGVPFHFPHQGKVIIGDNVWIGANTTIDRATIDATIIEDNVKIDNLVLIGHNCKIGQNTLITGKAMLCGGVTIGKKCWIAPNAVIYQQLKIGDNATVGIGSVVMKNVEAGATVWGNPARILTMKTE